MKFPNIIFSGFNGFKQFQHDELFLDTFTVIRPNEMCEELKSFQFFPQWNYNAFSMDKTVKINGIYQKELKFEQNVTKICGNEKYCLILLETGEIYRYSFVNDTNSLLKFLTVEKNESYQAPPLRKRIFVDNAVDNDKPEEFITDIGCGETMSVAVTNKNTIYSIPSKIHKFDSHVKIKKIACGIEHSLILTANGDVYSFGSGMRGQLGIGELTTSDVPVLVEALAGIKIIDVAAGGWHSCAISAFGDLYTWGWNTSGQLGIGPNIGTVHPLPLVIDFDVDTININRVACGVRHTIAISDVGMVYGCGWNRHGQLGIPIPKDIVKEDDKIGEDKFKQINVDFDVNKFNLFCGNWSTVFVEKQ